MAIKSLEDLKKIRDASKKKVDLREKGVSTDNIVELLVGMATCGIAAGARETMKALNETIEEMGLDNVKVVQVGCMGYCHSEPTVQVNVPGREPMLYGNVGIETAQAIIKEHIVGGGLLDEHILNRTFNKA
jgi:NADP-reducing hydrogenase subunit HndB